MVTRVYAGSAGQKPAPNLLINGAMDYFQRSGGATVAQGTGTTTVGGVATYYSAADRWANRPGGVASGNFSRSTDVPNSDFTSSIRFTDTAGAGGRSFQSQQRIEAAFVKPYIGKTMTFSVWVLVRAASAGTFQLQIGAPTIGLDSWAADPNTITGIATSAASSYMLGVWKRHYYTFVMPATAANGICTNLLFLGGSAGMDITYTGAMLTEGGLPPSFYRHGFDPAAELIATQRYFEKSYSIGQAVQTLTNNGNAWRTSFASSTSATRPARVDFQVRKRTATPAMTLYNDTTGVINSWAGYRSTGGTLPADTDVTVQVTNQTDGGFDVNVTGGWTLAVGDPVLFYGHWAAEAEL